ncbi:MAG TPA: M28 family peptidase [bacterium]|jgi:hypothetical protein
MISHFLRAALSVVLLASVCAAKSDDIEANLRQHENFLAADAREGRGIGTKGLDQSADYIAEQFKTIGLAPAFDGSYFQVFDMGWGVKLGPNNTLTAGTVKLDTASGFMPLGFSAAASVTGTVVFAGYGIIAPEYNYDDFAHIDATGKIVLCFTGEPGEFDSTSKFEGLNYTAHSGLRAKVGNAKLKGATALLIVEGPIYADKEKEVLDMPRTDEPYVDCGIPAVRLTREGLAKIFPKFDLETIQKLIDAKSEPRSIDLDTMQVTMTTDLTRKTVHVKNVAGILKGDTSVIVIGAHYDHLGYGQSGSLDPKPGKIHNGADDNASGVSSIIETARLLKAHPVRETVMICSFTGEEVGLVGSGHLVKDFPGGISHVRAMLNLDMVGRMRDKKFTILGGGTAKEFDSLVTAASKGLDIQVTCKGDGYGPSDHMSFFMADKPVLFFFTGAHEDYHKSSDDVDKINFPGMATIVHLTDNIVRAIDGYTPALTFVKTSDAPKESGGGRLRSSLGSVPDFSQPDSLKGYLIGDAKPEGSAAKAGLTKGDLVIRMGKVNIGNIYDLMNALRIYAPGDTVDITYLRGKDEKQTKAVLQGSARY